MLSQERIERHMARGHFPVLICMVAMLVLIMLLGGCGGDGGPLPGTGGTPPPPPPVVGSAVVQGIVVDATDVTIRIPGAQITVEGSGVGVVSDANGAFRLTQLDAGGVTLAVTFPSRPAYQAMRIVVDTKANTTTFVSIAALPAEAQKPNSVTLKPGEATIDIGGELQFTADVRVFGVPVDYTPSYSLIGSAGTLAANGLFTATRVGTAIVGAHFEGASDTSTVTVVGPRAPQLGTLNVSPVSLPSEGGTVRIAISVTDGDGVSSVEAEVEKPNRSIEKVPLAREYGTNRDGTWAESYSVGPNTNPPAPDGTQLPQTYSVRVRARDASGASATSQWIDFTVAGVEQPPAPL
ncbi:MAG: carboxypeptidase-like regulatory domain-containing protein [Candidatus Zipacnadales bacterium]